MPAARRKTNIFLHADFNSNTFSSWRNGSRVNGVLETLSNPQSRRLNAVALHLHAEQLSMGHHVLRAPVPVPEEYSTFAKYYAATDRWNDFATIGGIVDSSINRLQHCLASHLLQDSIIRLWLLCLLSWLNSYTVGYNMACSMKSIKKVILSTLGQVKPD